jgi:hypothetical protein
MAEQVKTVPRRRRVRVDDKGRVCLPKDLVANVSSFDIACEPDGRIVLSPFAEIPTRELWLHANPAAKAQVVKGLGEAAAGKTVDLGSFEAYVDDDADA